MDLKASVYSLEVHALIYITYSQQGRGTGPCPTMLKCPSFATFTTDDTTKRTGLSKQTAIVAKIKQGKQPAEQKQYNNVPKDLGKSPQQDCRRRRQFSVPPPERRGGSKNLEEKVKVSTGARNLFQKLTHINTTSKSLLMNASLQAELYRYEA